MTETTRSRRGPSPSARPGRGAPAGWTTVVLRAGLALLLLYVLWFAWLGFRAFQMKDAVAPLPAAAQKIKTQVSAGDLTGPQQEMEALKPQVDTLYSASQDPLWKAAAHLPFVGENFKAATAVGVAAHELVNNAGVPLTQTMAGLETALKPQDGQMDLGALTDLSAKVQAAAAAVSTATAEVDSVDSTKVVSQLAGPLDQLRGQLYEINGPTQDAAVVTKVLPDMVGASGPRTYLVLNQNNAELRATGGMPGSVMVLKAENGKVSLEGKDTAAALGTVDPPLKVDESQSMFYSTNMAKYFSGVGFTPDFPSAAYNAHEMYKQKRGVDVDGVIAIDPLVLKTLIEATGPMDVPFPVEGIPAQITPENALQVLLNDIYVKEPDTDRQDEFFSGVSEKAFNLFTSGAMDVRKLAEGMVAMSEEHRVLVWSRNGAEQAIINPTSSGGSMLQPSEGPAATHYGYFLNNRTGSKLDYYLRDSVELVQNGCSVEEGNTTTMRISLTSTAPADAGNLTKDITGGGNYGVEPGIMRIAAIGVAPPGARLEAMRVDGQEQVLALGQPQGLAAAQQVVNLAPGQTINLEYVFSNVDLTGRPTLRATPTVQPLGERVKEPQITATCS